MIRINLLGLKKEVKSAGGPSVTLEGAKLVVMGLTITGLALAGLAAHYFLLQSEENKLASDTKIAETEKARLSAVKAQYEQLDAAKKDLAHRIDNMEQLKRSQTGPVEMLTQLAGSVQASKMLWLTSFENTGDKLNLEGVAMSVNAVADFIQSLKRSGYFKNVEIKETFQADAKGEVTNFIFTLSTELPSAPAAEAAPAAAAGAAKPKT